MPQISEICQRIIDKRKEERLPAITNKIEVLGRLKNSLSALRDYQARLQGNSPSMTAIKEKAPQVVDAILNIDLTNLLGDSHRGRSGMIGKLEYELNRLHKRFSRNAIQVAIVGHARKGKSKFLQTVSGLDDDVIPTSSYSDCTGAVSVIENSNTINFNITIEYYGIDEFIRFFNNTLQRICAYSVRSLDDISQLGNTLKIESEKDGASEELKNFYKEFYSKGLNYLGLLGSKPGSFSDKSKVVELVAKYKEFKTREHIPQEYIKEAYIIEENEHDCTVRFNKYLAVKSAHIVCNYNLPEAGGIIMLDTIGLGNKSTEEKDKATMYKVLKEDTDAAIYNFLVEPGGMNETPTDVINEIDGIFQELEDMHPEWWVSVNENRYDLDWWNGDVDKYEKNGKLANTVFKNMQIKFGVGKKKVRPLHFSIVKNSDREDVVNKMMLPVLNGIAANVSKLDDVFMSTAETMADEIFAEYNGICNRLLKSFDKIISQSSSFYETFTSNYNALPLRKALNEYVGVLYARRNEVCQKIIDELKPQIANLTHFVPSEEEIAGPLWLSGMNGDHVNKVYSDISDLVTARIIAKLNDISTHTIECIQEKVKIDLAMILYEHGRLGELAVSTGKPKDENEAIRWLVSFMLEKLAKYPPLEDAVKSLIDFKMNIEGFIFAECIKACEDLRDRNITYPDDREPVSKKAYFIWDTLIHKVAEMKTALSLNLGLSKTHFGFGQVESASEMTKPSLLLWCAADSFCKQFLGTNHGEDLKSFYFEYAPIIWRNEFKMQEDISEVTEEVTELITELKGCNDRSMF